RDGSAVVAKTNTSADGVKDGFNVSKHTFHKDAFEEEGAYEINVTSEDAAGNIMESKEENGKVVFYVDRTAPTLSLHGINPKGIKGEATLTINASDLLTGVSDVKVTVNGEPVGLKDNEDGTYTFKLDEGMKQNIVVTAVDGAGNDVTIENVASVSSSAISLFVNNYKLPLGGGLVALLGAGLWFILGKRRKKDEQQEAKR
ncbi:MAG: hypothetical protein Q4B78_03930, partial [Bacillota bacterium]|nr:hypothetical protein [Bacillota bacterium]